PQSSASASGASNRVCQADARSAIMLRAPQTGTCRPGPVPWRDREADMNNRALFILARILIPSVFVGLGLERLLVAAGVLAGPPVSNGAALFSAFELAAGLLVMVGWKVRWVAALLAVFIVADAALSHAFWNAA